MFITAYLPQLASIAACVYMVVLGHTGWAVAFFVLAIIITPSIHYHKNKDGEIKEIE